MPMDTKTYEALGLHLPLPPTDKNKKKEHWVVPEADLQYNPCAEAGINEGNLRGHILSISKWSESRIYPESTRDIFIYVPPNLSEATEAPSLALFNDGELYLSTTGPVRAAHVLDSLIHNNELPATVGVFVNPGAERSFEYDSLTPTYLQFINDDILPLVEEQTGTVLHPDPARRLICGFSSGGICAFNTAWHSPESFGLVLSHCGSFTNIRGGNNYPFLIRSTEAKHIRVFLQSGELDLDFTAGSWPIANKDMAAALAYAGYDYQFVFGEGTHSLRHAGAIFADSLRWLFRTET